MSLHPSSLPKVATARIPERDSLGPAAGRIATMLGRPLLPWQRQVADTGLELLPGTGLPAHSLVLVTVPRQSGKTLLVLTVAVLVGLSQPGRRVWYTAQTGQDARDKWLELIDELNRTPLGRLATVRRSNGGERLRWFNGSQLRPFPPVPEALHGQQSDLVIVDECWSFTADRGAALEQAIIPTQATRPGGQLWLVSTAGSDASVWFRSYVDRGRAGDPSMAFFEWSIGPDDNPADLDAVIASHPAAGHTIDRAAVVRAASIMSAGEFARAFGNRWTATADRVIPSDVWAAQATDRPLPGGPPAFAVDVAADRSRASIAACVGDTVELIECRDGVAWSVSRLIELIEKHHPVAVVVDRVGPAGTVADQCEGAGIPLAPLTIRDLANSCAGFLDGLAAGTVWVRQHADLDSAADAAARRPVGDGGWAWARRGSSSAIDPLVAVTLAHWAYGHRPAEPVKPVVVSHRG
jgi:hypothetical protein